MFGSASRPPPSPSRPAARPNGRSQPPEAPPHADEDEDENAEEVARMNTRLRGEGASRQHREPPPGPGLPFGRLRVLDVGDAADMPPRTYLLHGIIGRGELSVWWGPPKCGKSFLMLRVAYGLAQGVGMWGRDAEAVPVLYIAAEGRLGFGQRIRAIADRMGTAPGFRWIGQTVDLFDAAADLRDIIEAVQHFGALFVVVDTMARAMPGANENDQRDMGIFVANCDAIREATGAHVALVHHGQEDARRGRGSTALPGAVDLAVKITGGPGLDVPRTTEITDVKDDEGGVKLRFRLTGFDLPPVDGRPRTTCIADEAEPGDEAEDDDTPGRKAPGGRAGLLLRLLDNLLAEGAGVRQRPMPGMPEVEAVALPLLRGRAIVADWFQENHFAKNSPDHSPDGGVLNDAGFKAEGKALETLIEKGIIQRARPQGRKADAVVWRV